MHKGILKVGLAVFVFFFCFILVYAEEQVTQTQGEFIVKFVKSLGLEYKLKEGATVTDYVVLLKEEGFTLLGGFDPNKIITKEEKAELLSQILSRSAVAEKGYESSAEVYRNKALIERIEGEVFVKIEEEGEWIPAKVNMELTEGSWIKTGKGSVVHLRVGVAGRVVVKENSELKLRELTTKPGKVAESILMYLALGEMTVDVRFVNPDSTFETHTPTTVAAVRGTIYTVKVMLPEVKTEIREVR